MGMENNASLFSVGLDLFFGSKYLYANKAGICEFYSIAPSDWQAVTFDSLEKAEQFVNKHYPNMASVYIFEKL